MAPAAEQQREGENDSTLFEIQPDLVYRDKRALKSLWIELPFECHLSCPYCFSQASNGAQPCDRGDLNEENYKTIVRAFLENGGQWIGIPGSGEPFETKVLPFTKCVFETAREYVSNNPNPQKNLTLTIFTAGDLILSEEVRDFLKTLADAQFVRVMVKWNSSVPEIQNKLVGLGVASDYTEKRAAGWVELQRLFKDNKHRLGIVTSILAENYWEVPYLLYKARRDGVIFDCDTLLPKGRGEHCPNMPTAGIIRRTVKEMLAVERLLGAERAESEQVSQEGMTGKKVREWNPAGAYIGSPCHRYLNHLYIDQRGAAFPCIGCTFGDHEIKLGMLTKEHLQSGADTKTFLIEAFENPRRKSIADRRLTGACAICDRHLRGDCASCLGRNAFGLGGQKEYDPWVATVPCEQFLPNFQIALHGTNLVIRKILSDRCVVEEFLDKTLESFWNPLFVPDRLSEIGLNPPLTVLPLLKDMEPKGLKNTKGFAEWARGCSLTQLLSDDSPVYMRVTRNIDGQSKTYRLILLPAGYPFLLPESRPVTPALYGMKEDWARKVAQELRDTHSEIDDYQVVAVSATDLLGKSVECEIRKGSGLGEEKIQVYLKETLLNLLSLPQSKQITDWAIEKVTWKAKEPAGKDAHNEFHSFDFVDTRTGRRVSTQTSWVRKFAHRSEIDTSWEDWFHKWSEKIFIPARDLPDKQDRRVKDPRFYDSGLTTIIPRLLLRLTTLRVDLLAEGDRPSWVLWLFYDPCKNRYFRRLVDFTDRTENPEKEAKRRSQLYCLYLWPEQDKDVQKLLYKKCVELRRDIWFNDHILNLADILRDPLMDYELDLTSECESSRALGCERFGVKRILEEVSAHAAKLLDAIAKSGLSADCLDRLAQVPLARGGPHSADGVPEESTNYLEDESKEYHEDIEAFAHCLEKMTESLLQDGDCNMAYELTAMLPPRLHKLIEDWAQGHGFAKTFYCKVINYFIFLGALKALGANHYFVGQTLTHNIYPATDRDSLVETRNITPSGFIVASKDPMSDGFIADLRLVYSAVMSPFIEQFAKWSPEYDSSLFRTSRNLPCLQRLPKHYVRLLDESNISPDWLLIADKRELQTEAQSTQVEEDLNWIRRLPKADLHVHLGPALHPHLIYDLSFLSLRRLVSKDPTKFQKDAEHLLDVIAEAIMKLRPWERHTPPIYYTDEFKRALVAAVRDRAPRAPVIDVNSAIIALAEENSELRKDYDAIACLLTVQIGGLVRDRKCWKQELQKRQKTMKGFRDYIKKVGGSDRLEGASGLQRARQVVRESYYSQCEHILDELLTDYDDQNFEMSIDNTIGCCAQLTPTSILQKLEKLNSGLIPRDESGAVWKWDEKVLGDPLSMLLSIPPEIDPKEKGLARYLGASGLTGSPLFQQADTLILALVETVKHAAKSDNVRYMEVKVAPSSLFGGKPGLENLGVSIALLALCYVTDRAVESMYEHMEKGLPWLSDENHVAGTVKIDRHNLARSETWPYILANLVLAGKRQGDRQSLRTTVMTAVDSRDRYLRWANEVKDHHKRTSGGGEKRLRKPGSITERIIADDEFGLIVPHVVGIDLVGRERGVKHSDLGETMAEAFDKCILLTIHAGEDESERSIWDAIFSLHAQRIGHALRMRSSYLSNLIRDRRIAVELCPTSNQYTNGYMFDGANQYVYKEYLADRITITINTDDPWISHRLRRKFLGSPQAVREVQPYPLSEEFAVLPLLFGDDRKEGETAKIGRIKRLEILRLIYNGFDNTFLSAPERDLLLTLVDFEAFSVLSCKDLAYRPS